MEESENIWQAAKYFTTSVIAKSCFFSIARMKNRNRNFVHETTSISVRLLQKLFPRLPAYMIPIQIMPQNPFSIITIIKKEVKLDHFFANPYKVPGYDGLLAIV